MAFVAVVGAKGYVGSALCTALKQTTHSLVQVTRENYGEMKDQKYDIVINAAMPGARFFAKNHPAEDFVETVQKTADLVYGWKYDKFIQISTISARCQLDTVYGRHKAAAEKICEFGDTLVVRLSAMYSPNITKGALLNIKRKENIYVDAESRYCFTPLQFVGEWISENLDKKGVIEVGARNTVSLREIADHLGVHVEFSGPVDVQEIVNPRPDFPDARDVLTFLDNWVPTP